MITDITGVVMAGGRSTRMGRDKALLPFRDRPLIETVLDTMRSVFSRVVISVREADSYEQVDAVKIADRYPDCGPMAGITSVLESGESRIFCVACDMPTLNPDLIRYLCSLTDCDAVIPLWRGNVEVLHAYYSGALLPHFQESLRQMRFRITDALGEGHIRYVQEPEIHRFDPQGLSFRNWNTPGDYEEASRPESGEL